jgi:hypothetical protein
MEGKRLDPIYKWFVDYSCPEHKKRLVCIYVSTSNENRKLLKNANNKWQNVRDWENSGNFNLPIMLQHFSFGSKRFILFLSISLLGKNIPANPQQFILHPEQYRFQCSNATPWYLNPQKKNTKLQ